MSVRLHNTMGVGIGVLAQCSVTCQVVRALDDAGSKRFGNDNYFRIIGGNLNPIHIQALVGRVERPPHHRVGVNLTRIFSRKPG